MRYIRRIIIFSNFCNVSRLMKWHVSFCVESSDGIPSRSRRRRFLYSFRKVCIPPFATIDTISCRPKLDASSLRGRKYERTYLNDSSKGSVLPTKYRGFAGMYLQNGSLGSLTTCCGTDNLCLRPDYKESKENTRESPVRRLWSFGNFVSCKLKRINRTERPTALVCSFVCRQNWLKWTNKFFTILQSTEWNFELLIKENSFVYIEAFV